ncbi:MAG: ribonuclease HIII [Clostridiaceae bacterium]|nr:ribonuclease HIII [Clostridiaceae bacterium]
MYKAKDKYDYYEYLKNVFKNNEIEISSFGEINYGLQFSVFINGRKCLIRVYESKKSGIKCDFSQVKDEESLRIIEDILNTGSLKTEYKNIKNVGKIEEPETELIGTDESGKGDYFGPLVIAGVYADAEMKKKLKEIGAVDSKTLSDTRIHKLAEEIARVCQYSVVTVGNRRYNEMYDEIKNLNKLLAWGHARVIENLLELVECNNVLSDQFGSPELIKNALMEKGRKVELEQRPRAEENVVVAAASILARNEYVKAMDKLSEEYEMEFPKGGSAMVVEAAREFVLVHGKGELNNVAKLHFVITGKL